jgi:predicted RNase H-like HicB family nuclease
MKKLKKEIEFIFDTNPNERAVLRAVKEYLNEGIDLTISIYKKNKWYVSMCLEMGVSSQGKTEEEALENVKEAIQIHYDYAKENNNMEYLFSPSDGKEWYNAYFKDNFKIFKHKL